MWAIAIPPGAAAQGAGRQKPRSTCDGKSRATAGRTCDATRLFSACFRLRFGLYFCLANFDLAAAAASVTGIFWEPAAGSRIVVTEAPRRRATASQPWILPDEDNSI